MDTRIYISTLLSGVFIVALLVSVQFARADQPVLFDVIKLTVTWGVLLAAGGSLVAVWTRHYLAASRLMSFAALGHLIFVVSFVVTPNGTFFDGLILMYVLSSAPFCVHIARKLKRAVTIRASIRA